ncbi:YueH family protein [Ectobacillus funiculus]|uniref:YueH family protein n=1 Tax=Ectobacillus funiculus TaxID=137993 RepID=A0ABV5WLM8_9BACI
MKQYDVAEGTRVLKVYLENINENRVLVAIPQKEWSFLLRYDIGTHDEAKQEYNELLRSLCRQGLQYQLAQELADVINKAVHNEKTPYDNVIRW